ncbi:cell wall-active antibiotics response protein LiaF [Xylocopilactobacillus apicola]|uniref:Cell wall-active antibiotics response LiaF-like C-terminal domain-containing protein n=1 Tax=Xylocopilactobacillus apicola TaxID=2932184 RepID=A0AAU9DT16_9LACO|nr:cell wall-active antibiotics response protein LiaF [Xylocopilactobacillus apicola]BDR58478.1 hypothetical protein XA3_09190 [Xylocopilactobacillus apicola]
MKQDIQYKKIKLKNDRLPSGLEIQPNNLINQPSNQPFYWDDLNLLFFKGNYLLDLGDTILPSQAVMVVRCFWGKVRIIVPIGVGVFVDFAAYRGNFIFEEKQIVLKNERVRYKKPKSDEFPQRINIYLNSFISTLEIVLG